MRVVLYSDDMEPITVIELQGWLYERLKVGEVVSLVVPDHGPLNFVFDDLAPINTEFRVLHLRAEKFVRKSRAHFFIFAGNEVDALAMDSTLLPGQRRQVTKEKQAAYIRGQIELLMKLRML